MEKKTVDNYKTGFSESSIGRETDRKNASSLEKRKSDDGDGNNAKKKSKISFGFIKPLSTPPTATTTTLKPAAVSNEIKPLSIQMTQTKKNDSSKINLAFNKAFNNDEDDEEDEMPPEARMRMRNIGRETPTSCGPNSFGKTKQGFCDARSGGTSTKLPKTKK